MDRPPTPEATTARDFHDYLDLRESNHDSSDTQHNNQVTPQTNDQVIPQPNNQTNHTSESQASTFQTINAGPLMRAMTQDGDQDYFARAVAWQRARYGHNDQVTPHTNDQANDQLTAPNANDQAIPQPNDQVIPQPNNQPNHTSEPQASTFQPINAGPPVRAIPQLSDEDFLLQGVARRQFPYYNGLPLPVIRRIEARRAAEQSLWNNRQNGVYPNRRRAVLSAESERNISEILMEAGVDIDRQAYLWTNIQLLFDRGVFDEVDVNLICGGLGLSPEGQMALKQAIEDVVEEETGGRALSRNERID